MQTLIAKIRGRVVEYPMHATFTIERRKGTQVYGLLASRETISSALKKYESSKLAGHRTRLSAVTNGKITPLISERA
jgi:hypothetical protein